MLFVLCGRAGGRAGLRVATQVCSEREARAAKAMQGIIALQAAIPPPPPHQKAATLGLSQGARK